MRKEKHHAYFANATKSKKKAAAATTRAQKKAEENHTERVKNLRAKFL